MLRISEVFWDLKHDDGSQTGLHVAMAWWLICF